MTKTILTDDKFIPTTTDRTIDTSKYEKLYSELERDEVYSVAIQGSRIYGYPRLDSDVDVFEIYPSGGLYYEEIDYKNFVFGMHRVPKNSIINDIKNNTLGGMLKCCISKFSKPIIRSDFFNEIQKKAIRQLFEESLVSETNKFNSEIVLTPSYALRLVCKRQVYYEPERCAGIVRCFFESPKKDRNIAYYYQIVSEAIEDSELISEVGHLKDERLFSVNQQECKNKKSQFENNRLRAICKFKLGQTYGTKFWGIHEVNGIKTPLIVNQFIPKISELIKSIPLYNRYFSD